MKIGIIVGLIIVLHVFLHYEYFANWSSHVMSFISLGKSLPKKKIDDQISLCGNFYVFNSDKMIANVICKGNTWEAFLQKYFQRYSDKNKLALDIGANIGTHSLELSKHFKYVLAFEPLFYDILQKNMDYNRVENVNVLPYGLSNKQAQIFIKKNDLNPGNSNISQHGDIPIHVYPLDHLTITTPIGLMKIDVEGHELEVLKGAVNTIKKHKPIILIEIKHKKVFDFIKQMGYSLKRIMIEDYLCIPL